MKEDNVRNACRINVMAVHDAMDILGGKWIVSIVASLCYHNSRRFSEILVDVNGISNKMLSKELKELEVNKIIKRTVLDTQPITVRYELTEYGRTLKPVVETLIKWGINHRKEMFGK